MKRQSVACIIQLLEDKRMDKNVYISKNKIEKGFNGKQFVFEICDLHHRLHKSKWAVKKFPLFINSLLNLVGVSHDMHLKYPSSLKISEGKAIRYEYFLQHHPKIAKFVNGEFEC